MAKTKRMQRGKGGKTSTGGVSKRGHTGLRRGATRDEQAEPRPRAPRRPTVSLESEPAPAPVMPPDVPDWLVS